MLCAPVSAPWLKASEAVDFARAVRAPRNLAIHDRVYSEAGLGIVDGHMNRVPPQGGIAVRSARRRRGPDMTQPPNPPTAATPGPEAAKVAELEKKLADAAAEVAKVQTELSQARAADPNTPEVPVPYSGQAPVVMINGQPVPGGQAVDISAMLGGFFGGARRRGSPPRRTAPRRSRCRRWSASTARWCPAASPSTCRSSWVPRWPLRSGRRSASSAWTRRSARCSADRHRRTPPRLGSARRLAPYSGDGLPAPRRARSAGQQLAGRDLGRGGPGAGRRAGLLHRPALAGAGQA